MDQMIVAAVLGSAAVVFAWVVNRRQASQPAPTGWAVPAQLNRADFSRPEAPWLVAVFTSETCGTCHEVWTKAEVLQSDAVACQEAEVSRDPQLHTTYGIEAVPTTVIADADGVVRRSFLGPVTATDLWAAVAELRDPGSVPPQCTDHTA